MAWFKRKPDPIADRANSLNKEIAELEAQIRDLDKRLKTDESAPRLRSTALPHGGTVTHAGPTPAPAAAPAKPLNHEPIFEEMDQQRLKARAEADAAMTPDHYNTLGVRKYDLPALIQRLRNSFHGPATTNPKLVSYLAAGGIQGLRPLRYEKRVARNQFVFLVIVLFIILVGIIALVRGR